MATCQIVRTRCSDMQRQVSVARVKEYCLVVSWVVKKEWVRECMYSTSWRSVNGMNGSAWLLLGNCKL